MEIERLMAPEVQTNKQQTANNLEDRPFTKLPSKEDRLRALNTLSEDNNEGQFIEILKRDPRQLVSIPMEYRTLSLCLAIFSDTYLKTPPNPAYYIVAVENIPANIWNVDLAVAAAGKLTRTSEINTLNEILAEADNSILRDPKYLALLSERFKDSDAAEELRNLASS